MSMAASSSREKVNLTKRTNTLMKKTQELATLCGIDVALLIVVEDDDGIALSGNHSRPTKLLTWPQNPSEVDRILKRNRDNLDGGDGGGRGRKRRKIAEINNPTVETLSTENFRVLLDILDSKLTLVNSRKRELELQEKENMIRCTSSPPYGACVHAPLGYDWESSCFDDGIVGSLMNVPDFGDISKPEGEKLEGGDFWGSDPLDPFQFQPRDCGAGTSITDAKAVDHHHHLIFPQPLMYLQPSSSYNTTWDCGMGTSFTDAKTIDHHHHSVFPQSWMYLQPSSSYSTTWDCGAGTPFTDAKAVDHYHHSIFPSLLMYLLPSSSYSATN